MSLRLIVLQLAFAAIFAFLGGFTAQVLLAAKPGFAQETRRMLAGTLLEVMGPDNKKGVEAYVSDGQAEQIFYGEDGKPRIEMGSYPGAGERGQPLTGLWDNKGELRLLLRLAGPTDSPVIVMKDSQGRDRLVMGLSFDAKQDPFLNITDSTGANKNLFGFYGGHP
jgi:hypothetical protein